MGGGNVVLLDEDTLKENYPNTHSYLESHKDELSARQDSRRYYADGDDWYCFLRPGRFDYVTPKKLIMKGVATRATSGYLGRNTLFSGANCPGYIPNNEIYTEYFTALLNSSLISEYLVQVCPAKMQGYTRFNANNLNKIPVIPPVGIDWQETESLVTERFSLEDPELVSEQIENLGDRTESTLPVLLGKLAEFQREHVDQRERLNTSLVSHLGSYSSEGEIGAVGLIQPQTGGSRLDQTASSFPNLRIGTATVDRESSNTVLIKATARYKPDDEDRESRPKGGSRTTGTGEARGGAHETDRWGYTETDLLPAFRITDLTETEADLIEHFVPVAVDEAGGFANFRETATKTNSLVDRLKAIELPDVDDVADDLANYLETAERAEELDGKIEKTDALIDEIVYELYGLTDEEIEIVEEAVGA